MMLEDRTEGRDRPHSVGLGLDASWGCGLPEPCDSEGWLAFERNDRGVMVPGGRLGTESTITRNGRGLDGAFT